ncbi:MAG: bacterioferritin (cytochrome b1) [Bacteroidales bacterium]|nr:bacterioferritin (cytochrome b1) [Bacteroidales bacterium]
MDKQKSIEALQFFITNLNAQSFQHKLQAKVFGSLGFHKLETKYQEHAEEEQGFVDQFIDRLLDLGGDLKQEAVEAQTLYKDPIEFLKADYKVSVDGIEMLRKCIDSIKDDLTTFDILKDYLKDEEEDMYWSEEQLGLIECIGSKPWLMKAAL